MTLAFFKVLGYFPVSIQRLNIKVNISLIGEATSLMTCRGTSCNEFVLQRNFAIKLFISRTDTGKKKKEFYLLGQTLSSF